MLLSSHRHGVVRMSGLWLEILGLRILHIGDQFRVSLLLLMMLKMIVPVFRVSLVHFACVGCGICRCDGVTVSASVQYSKCIRRGGVPAATGVVQSRRRVNDPTG